MSELLIELFSEEIPARMQSRGAEDLKKLVTDALVDQGLTYEGAQSHAGPRRLVLSVEGLAAATPDKSEERKGPRIDAPEKAIEGFLKSAGVSRDQCEVQEDKKGAFLVAKIARKGRPTPEVIAEIVPAVIRRCPWPKSMRWGSGSLRWVRPLKSILCTFDGEVVAFDVDGIASGNRTYGHRFMAPAAITARRFADYSAQLEKARVTVDAGHRARTIHADAKTLAFAQGFELIEDEALVAETAGLVEWPVMLMGAFDESFLDLPSEVIRATIRANQKCFVLRDPKSGKLANRYLLVSNLIAKDGGKQIVEGNNRVIAARLSDARFFWDQDLKVKLEGRLESLKAITFHAKLGSQYERVERIERLAGEIAKIIGADVQKAKLAARLCKADLVTGMVGEFPELQGLMGGYYARAEGLDEGVADAIAEHYKPQGPSDSVPEGKVAQAVALADKIDTLVGFWAIDERPTGSKDPYALRRAALGVIRIVLDSEIRLELLSLFETAFIAQFSQIELAFIGTVKIGFEDAYSEIEVEESLKSGVHRIFFDYDGLLTKNVKWFNLLRKHDADAREEESGLWEFCELLTQRAIAVDRILTNLNLIAGEEKVVNLRSGSNYGEYELELVATALDQLRDFLLAFFADRLKVHLREQGARYDLIDAVFALGSAASAPSPLVGEGRGRGSSSKRATPTPSPSPQGGGEQMDDLLMIVRRVEALGKFLDTDDGKTLLAGVKRATNILRIEEKKDGHPYDGAPDPNLLVQGEEKELNRAIAAAEANAKKAVGEEDFEAAMRAMAKLRGPVDRFFDKVTVNADDPSFRENRLKLLSRIRAATLTVADFSKIEG